MAAADSHLMAADELDLADLAGEIVVVPRDDVLHLAVPGAIAPSFAPPEDTEMAIATVAAGIGVVIVPMSLARLHQRKDVDYRPLRDGPVSTVALAWPADRTTPAVQAFVGIVRGRTPELLALTGTPHRAKVGGCRRPGSLRHPPRIRLRRLRVPNTPVPPAPSARQSPDTGCCESSPNNRSTVSAP